MRHRAVRAKTHTLYGERQWKRNKCEWALSTNFRNVVLSVWLMFRATHPIARPLSVNTWLSLVLRYVKFFAFLFQTSASSWKINQSFESLCIYIQKSFQRANWEPTVVYKKRFSIFCNIFLNFNLKNILNWVFVKQTMNTQSFHLV